MSEPKLLGNGEGHTVLILTDAESRLIRKVLAPLSYENAGFPMSDVTAAEAAFNRGIHRGTERIAAEFAAEQKRKKEPKR